MTPIDYIGWLGGVLFAICALPQAVKTTKLGSAHDLSALMLWLWGAAEALMLVYLLVDLGFDGPLFLNYTVNLLAVIWILRYKHFPRRAK